MTTIGLALISALIVNGMHGYLLWSQRDERKWSISVHASKDRRTYTIYLIGHFLAGLFFAIFAYRFFVTTHDVKWLFWLSLFGLVFEYVQALLPARGKTNNAHAVTAYAMFVSYAVVALIAMITLDLSIFVRLVAIPFLIMIPVFGIIAVRYQEKMYFAQMVAIASFSLVMIIYAVESY